MANGDWGAPPSRRETFYLIAQLKKRKAINDYITDMFSGRMRVHGTTHLREKKNNEV